MKDKRISKVKLMMVVMVRVTKTEIEVKTFFETSLSHVTAKFRLKFCNRASLILPSSMCIHDDRKLFNISNSWHMSSAEFTENSCNSRGTPYQLTFNFS